MPLIGQEIPLTIINTVEALWREDRRPQIHSRKRLSNGWEFVFALPAGMTFKQFASNDEAFRDAIGDVTTEVVHVGKMAILKIIQNRIAERYIYDWDYRPSKKMILPIPIGYANTGLIEIDLAKVYNILIGGFVGGGKSNAVHVMVNSLLHLKRPPRIVIADFKLLEYNYLKESVLLVTDQISTYQALSRLVVEMRNRLQIFADWKCVNIEAYNKKTSSSMDYIVLVIDELAELNHKPSQEHLETLLRLCRATGIHVILATQRPDSTIFGNKKFGSCKANLIGRLCFQVADGVNSKIILDSTEAAKLSNIPGRAIWKLGDRTIEIQVPYLDPDIAEVKLLEQPSEVYQQGYADDQDDPRMGNTGHRAITNSFVSLLQSGTKAIATLAGAKKN
jgi:S-DNA-T family DNA segregation ATPase FtsK/SpoIIIE